MNERKKNKDEPPLVPSSINPGSFPHGDLSVWDRNGNTLFPMFLSITHLTRGLELQWQELCLFCSPLNT